MPIEWTESQDGAYIEIKASGTVSDADWFALHEALLGNAEKAGRIKHVLSDWTGASDVRITSEAIRRSAQLLFVAKFNGAIATIASEGLVYGLARMWAAYVDRASWPHALFKDVKSAKEWLHSDANG